MTTRCYLKEILGVKSKQWTDTWEYEIHEIQLRGIDITHLEIQIEKWRVWDSSGPNQLENARGADKVRGHRARYRGVMKGFGIFGRVKAIFLAKLRHPMYVTRLNYLMEWWMKPAV